MSLVYLSGNKKNNVNVSNCKQELINIGHSVIVVEKFDWNILCRCDVLVCADFGENNEEVKYAYEHGILIYSYYDLPKLEKYEINMPTIIRMTTEISMKEYRNNILMMNFGEFISDDKVQSVSYEDIVV